MNVIEPWWAGLLINGVMLLVVLAVVGLVYLIAWHR